MKFTTFELKLILKFDLIKLIYVPHTKNLTLNQFWLSPKELFNLWVSSDKERVKELFF